MTGKQLKDSILQWAIQGKLVPQDPNDEPASVLLERIRAEKAQLIKEKKIKKPKTESIIYRGEDNSYYEKFSDGRVVCIDEEVPFELPKGWEWCRMASIVSVLGDGIHGTPEYDINGNVFFVNGNNLSNGHILIKNDTKRINSKEAIKHYRKLDSTTVLVSINGTIGNVALYNDESVILGKSACYLNLMCNISRLYIKLIFETFYFLEYAKKVATGSTIKNVPLYGMRDFLLPLPPLNEQDRIVEKLNLLQNLIELYSVLQEKTNHLNKTVFELLKKTILQEAIQGKLVPQNPADEPACELLKKIREEKERLIKEKKIKADKNESVIFKGDDNSYYEQIGKEVRCIDDEVQMELPDGWVYTRLGMIGDWGSGSTPAKGHPEYYGGNILWLRTGELNNSIVYDTEIKITEKALQECHFRINKPGDVLIAMYGATIGKVAIAGVEMTTNQACCGCTPLGVFNEFLFYFLMANKDNFTKQGEGGAQPNISKEKITSYLFPLPPLAEQHRIVQKLKELFAQLK